MSGGAPGGLGLRRHLLIGAVILAVVAAGAYAVVLAEQPTPQIPGAATPVASSTLSVGSAAPLDFTLAELDGTARTSLGAIVGHRPAIVNFFASWCVACQQELATIARYAARERGRIAVVGIDTDEHDLAASRALVHKAHASYPILLDPGDDPVETAYGIAALPVTFFLTASGAVALDHLGRITAAELSSGGAEITAPNAA